MSFASTITLTLGATPYVLNRINQDNFGSEYLYEGSDRSLNMKIRHSVDSVDGDGITMKRHNVFVEEVIFPTPTALLKKVTFTATLRGGKLQDPALCSDLGAAVVNWLDTAGVVTDLAIGVN